MLSRVAVVAAAVAVLAGCGGRGAATTPQAHPRTTAARRTLAREHPLSAADVRFLHLLAAYAREDDVGASLAARKAAAPQLHATAMREADEATRELSAAAALLARAHQRANGTPATLRRAWSADYETPLVNAGSPFDAVYAPLMERRDAVVAALARRELAAGRSARARALAGGVVRRRSADERSLRVL
ncbi:MAG TPA: hypothetical protein VFA05_09840 [Gaiellaceae bacterium]|nr:hypothetical protein [Gaiellaceae bacterium]